MGQRERKPVLPESFYSLVGYKLGFVDDAAVWLLMIKKRNTSVHIYDEDEVDEMLLLIRDSFVPAFIRLRDTLKVKAAEAEVDWN